MISAGALDQQITVEKKTVTVDSVYGTELVTWIPLVAEPGSPTVAVRFWAQVQDVLPSRSEGVTQGLAVARNQIRIRFRFRDDVDSSMRVVVHWGDNGGDIVHQIVGGPSTIGRKQWTEIVTERYSS